MYRALIVEDTPREAEKLRANLLRYGAENGLTFSVETIGSALEYVERNPTADIIFMDIGMPGIDGLEAAGILRQHDSVTPLIFVTDLAQYAVKGYQVDALDFMVKPVEYEDFSLRMQRAMRVISRNAETSVSVATVSGTHIVPAKSIIYVEILNHNLYYHVEGEPEPLRTRGTLGQASQELGEELFCRISASFLVNMSQLKLVRGNGVVMSDGTELSFSRSRKKGALETISRFVGGSI